MWDIIHFMCWTFSWQALSHQYIWPCTHAFTIYVIHLPYKIYLYNLYDLCGLPFDKHHKGACIHQNKTENNVNNILNFPHSNVQISNSISCEYVGLRIRKSWHNFIAFQDALPIMLGCLWKLHKHNVKEMFMLQSFWLSTSASIHSVLAAIAGLQHPLSIPYAWCAVLSS